MLEIIPDLKRVFSHMEGPPLSVLSGTYGGKIREVAKDLSEGAEG